MAELTEDAGREMGMAGQETPHQVTGEGQGQKSETVLVPAHATHQTEGNSKAEAHEVKEDESQGSALETEMETGGISAAYHHEVKEACRSKGQTRTDKTAARDAVEGEWKVLATQGITEIDESGKGSIVEELHAEVKHAPPLGQR